MLRELSESEKIGRRKSIYIYCRFQNYSIHRVLAINPLLHLSEFRSENIKKYIVPIFFFYDWNGLKSSNRPAAVINDCFDGKTIRCIG